MKYKAKPWSFVFWFCFVCWAARAIEYVVFRTEQTAVGEAIFHKLFGIALLAAALWLIGWKWCEIGFVPSHRSAQR